MKSTAQKLHDYRMALRAHYDSQIQRKETRPKPSRAVFPGILSAMLDRIDAEELANYERQK